MAKERKGKAGKGKKRKGQMNWPNGREGRGRGCDAIVAVVLRQS